MTRRLYFAVAACAGVVYLGTLWNRWAWDDLTIIYTNAFVHTPSALWRAFAAAYWPDAFGGGLYRPLTIASYAVDWQLGAAAWFHGVNLLWHAATSVAVTLLARRWSGDRAALVAGLIFAVHPVHVEAVANIVGRAELMAALFALLAVYAALDRDSLGWSLLASVAALLSKETGAVVPALIAWGWIVRVGRRPARRRMAAYVAAWVVLGVARSEEHTSELQSPCNLVCRLLLEKKKTRPVRNT